MEWNSLFLWCLQKCCWVLLWCARAQVYKENFWNYLFRLFSHFSVWSSTVKWMQFSMAAKASISRHQSSHSNIKMKNWLQSVFLLITAQCNSQGNKSKSWEKKRPNTPEEKKKPNREEMRFATAPKVKLSSNSSTKNKKIKGSSQKLLRIKKV